MTEETLLRLTGVCKSYAGVQALRGVSFELRAGEVHALVGENGAGKSTLVKVITGAVRQDAGEIEVQGKPVGHYSPRAAKELGIAAIYQQPPLFPELTVTENIALASEGRGRWARVDWPRRRERATELLRRAGARIDPDTEAGDLTMPEQQLVEIASALGTGARILIFDEPTASLSEDDSRNLFEVIKQLRAAGAGIVYISHRLEELSAIADRVTVLRDGLAVTTNQASEVDRDQLIRMMVGRDLSASFPKRVAAPGDTVLELRGVGCSATRVSGVDLSVRAGEIVGLAGLVGAGRTELARILFGLNPADSGEIRLRGQIVRIADPAQAIGLGIAHLPEDRCRHGVILDMAVSANITLASLPRFARRAAFDFAGERTTAARYVEELHVKTPATFTPVSSLSGGNQQKVALGRWLLTNPVLLILDEPTQGIDIGAKSEIHTLIRELASRGIAILMISSELPEIVGLSDRVAVMRDGTITEILCGPDITPETILARALGHRPGVGVPAA